MTKSNSQPLILGFDIGGTKTAVLLGNLSAEILLRQEFPTLTQQPFETTFKRMVDEADKLLHQAEALRYPKPDAISVSVGGPLDIERGIIYAPIHLPNWVDAPLKDLLADFYDLPVYVEHDGNAGALAEYYFGAGRGCQNIIFLTAGTGLGAGIILNGQVYRGSTDCAGEVGFIRMKTSQSPDYIWEGSLESYCSAAGVTRLAHQNYPQIWDQDTAASVIIQSALGGQPEACDLIAECGDWLGKGLAVIANTLNPERIIVGTLGVVLGDMLLAPARESMVRGAIPRAGAACNVVPAGLGSGIGDVAALMAAIHAHKTGKLQLDPNTDLQMVETALKAGIDVRQKTLATLPELICQSAQEIIQVLKHGSKVLLCGNGGSAATAQHLAGELSGRYLAEREPLAAIALTADTSVLTCIGNDYAYAEIFARQVRALGRPGDLLIAFTTSGKSSNVIEAIHTAKDLGLSTLALTGEDGLHGLGADLVIPVPSKITARIQEEHDAIIHAFCDLIDKAFT